MLSTPYPHRKAVFVARSFDFGRKKRLQPPCAAISRFSYCEVNPLLFRLPLSPLLLRLQSVCLYRSYRPAARQAAAARWISPHCCSGRKIDLPKYDTGLQGHRIPVNSAVVPCSRYSQGSAGKYITRRLPFAALAVFISRGFYSCPESLKVVQWYGSFCHFHSPCYILQFTFLFGYVHTIHIIRLNTSCCVLTVD